MRVLKPSRLVKGDTIGVVAPSHPVLQFQEKYDKGIGNLKKLGFNVKEGKTVKLQCRGYMAGTDVQRAEDINAMFADEEVKAVVCALGGSVAVRTLRFLDYGLIGENPKIFSGMSNITTFHLAFMAKTGLAGLHQSDVVFGFGEGMGAEAAKYEMELFCRITMETEPMGQLPPFSEWKVWREGRAEGKLFGGSINSAETLLGTPYYPRLDEDVIFFWESIGQPIEELDAKLVHFRESGAFERVRGMLVGKFREEASNSSNESGPRIVDMTDKIQELVLDVTADYDFPIIAGLDFGHYTPNLPLPLGIKADMDTRDTRVSLTESYVK